jgi:hypothetical protein
MTTVFIAHLWSAYRDFQARRAAVVMQGLDDGTLAALGVDRRAIETAVDTAGVARPRG